MLSRPDFMEKQIVFCFANNGDKLSFRNDNLLVKSKNNETKLQSSCYRIFAIFIVGDALITTGLFKRLKEFGISLILLNGNLKPYQIINAKMEGNTLLRKKQYEYTGIEIAKWIVINKIENQIATVKTVKNVLNYSDYIEFDEYINNIKLCNSINEIMAYEGNASKRYFSIIFDNTNWNGRIPRIKKDWINASLDIGYTLLFNFVSCVINLFGFDEYNGVLHRFFYMRKSLVCDLIEVFRPQIDICTRKSINLKQFKKEDFTNNNGRYELQWKNRKKYITIYTQTIIDIKEDIFIYVRNYYRNFSNGKDIKEYKGYYINC